MLILHKTMWRPGLPGMRLTLKKLTFQMKSELCMKSELYRITKSFILSSCGCVKMLWIDKKPNVILVPFLEKSRILCDRYLLIWLTELSCPWARESKKSLNKKDREWNIYPPTLKLIKSREIQKLFPKNREKCF